MLENGYVIVFAKTSSHEMLLNIFLNIFIFNYNVEELTWNKSHDGQTPSGNAISKLKIFRHEGNKPLEYDPKGHKQSSIVWRLGI